MSFFFTFLLLWWVRSFSLLMNLQGSLLDWESITALLFSENVQCIIRLFFWTLCYWSILKVVVGFMSFRFLLLGYIWNKALWLNTCFKFIFHCGCPFFKSVQNILFYFFYIFTLTLIKFFINQPVNYKLVKM